MRSSTRSFSAGAILALALAPLPMMAGTGGGPPPDRTFSGTIEVDSTVSGSAARGPYTKDGVELMTSDAGLTFAQNYAARYSGRSKFTGRYDITVSGDGALKAGSVTFETKTFTVNGALKGLPVFSTNPLEVTDVTLTEDKTGLLAFSFSSNDWYPVDATSSNIIKDSSLTGGVDFLAEEAWITAKYSWKTNGALLTYDVDGALIDPDPGPEGEEGDDPDFAPPPDSAFDDDADALMVGSRGRDGSFGPPPAQIRTCGIPAYGSSLR